MKFSHRKKRMNVKVDRLSSLPDGLIHQILSFIDIKRAIQTSALSSRWRFIWTLMPHLNFSRSFFFEFSNFSEFVTLVLFNHNIRKGVRSVYIDRCVLFIHKQILTSTLELPSLTTLYLHYARLDCIGIFSKCANLKNLTLKQCKLYGTEGSSICLPLLSSLTLDEICGIVKGFNIDAPQLKNLTMRYFFLKELQCLPISAPDLVFFLYKGNRCLPFSTDGFLSLEKADICAICPTNAHRVLRLLQQLHNVKSLTLNLEIIELLSSSVELMLHISSPFANLKSLNIHPVSKLEEVYEIKRVTMSVEVKRFLLDSSPGATFTMVSREDIRARNKTRLALNFLLELRVLLEKEQASIKTKMANMRKRWKAQVDIVSCLDYMSVQVQEGKEKVSNIVLKLENIKEFLGELPASNMAIIQPSLSALYREADIVKKKIIDSIKMDCEESQRRLSECFLKLVTTLQPSY